MTTAITPTNGAMAGLESALIGGDLGKLSQEQRVEYYARLCASLDLNPLTRPFEYLTLQGKLVLYARKDATEQLRSKRGVSITRLERETAGDLYIVTAYAQLPDGRQDSDFGAVSIKGLSGDVLVNAILKAVTKAKRRVTLSICGLGLLDETEIETIPDARPAMPQTPLAPEQNTRAAGFERTIDNPRVKALRDEGAQVVGVRPVGLGPNAINQLSVLGLSRGLNAEQLRTMCQTEFAKDGLEELTRDEGRGLKALLESMPAADAEAVTAAEEDDDDAALGR